MDDLSLKVITMIMSGNRVAFIGEDSEKAIRKLSKEYKTQINFVHIDSVDTLMRYSTTTFKPCIIDSKLRHLVSRFPMWVYTVDDKISAVCTGRLGDCLHKPLTEAQKSMQFGQQSYCPM